MGNLFHLKYIIGQPVYLDTCYPFARIIGSHHIETEEFAIGSNVVVSLSTQTIFMAPSIYLNFII
jgi:hypothetical protein